MTEFYFYQSTNFDSIEEIINSINDVLRMNEDNSVLVFSLMQDGQSGGNIFIVDGKNRTVHAMYFSDQEKLLSNISSDFLNKNDPEIDQRIWSMQWIIRHSFFLLLPDVTE